MEFLVLGPLEVIAEGRPLAVEGAIRRRVLSRSLLAERAGAVVSASRARRHLDR